MRPDGLAPGLRGAIERAIEAATGSPFRTKTTNATSGGCIHRSFVIAGDTARYFVKTNERRFLDAFEAEADGVAALGGAGVRVPQPLACGESAGESYLVLEHLELRSGGDGAALGRMLAKVHARTGAGFGWHRDNYIGATPQQNAEHIDWAEFFREERLAPQLELAARNGYGEISKIGDRMCGKVGALLAGHRPAPSLLHGDLWGGNAAFLADGTPVLFDPAVYHGDAETDLAMTELFGGFGADFYAAYRELRPELPGYRLRRELYNLYHVLNHANLFGGGYVGQARRTMERLAGLS